MIATPLTAPLLRGIADLEETSRGVRPHRLPGWVRSRFPDPQLLSMEAQPAGVRLSFTTLAETIELVSHPTRLAYRGIARPRGAIDLVIDDRPAGSDLLDGGDIVEVDLATGASERLRGPSHVSRFTGLPAGDKLVELWLPHNEALELVALRT
ncbi:MAG: lipase, partial [Propionicimonas sp.]